MILRDLFMWRLSSTKVRMGLRNRNLILRGVEWYWLPFNLFCFDHLWCLVLMNHFVLLRFINRLVWHDELPRMRSLITELLLRCTDYLNAWVFNRLQILLTLRMLKLHLVRIILTRGSVLIIVLLAHLVLILNLILKLSYLLL